MNIKIGILNVPKHGNKYNLIHFVTRDLVRVVGIVAPLPRGVQYSRKICIIEKPGVQDEWGRHFSSLPRSQSSGTEPSASSGYCCPLCPAEGQYSGKIRFIEKPGVKYEGGRHVTKRCSDPWVAYPEVKVQVRDPVRVVGIVALFAQRGSLFGINSFYRAPVGKWV